jgi:hypothetical protein
MDEQSVDGGGSPADGGVPEVSEPGFLKRAILVFADPERAFAAVDRRPATWWQPLLLMAVLGLVIVYLIYDRVILPEQLAALERRFEGEELAQARGTVEGGLVRGIAYASGFLGAVIATMVTSLLAHLVAAYLLGGTATFVRTLAVVSYALLVGVVESLVKVAMMITLSTPHVFFGPALLLEPQDPPTFLFALLSHIDLFTLWKLWLIAVGLALVHRIGRNSILWALLGLWTLWAVGSSAVQAALGG